ncbi:uncharacterized protein IL334_006329 [Kwoniella shivajii]|uniref:Glycosyl transferase CAP10 domain-containing protein n=1 Tax=Kwoniella shivajii TaxID=564305 RepID=A0ABZ1D602_9TREE|nr:hypothetical protein IL334_006329 [Kwoniella shivajii]
MFSGRRKSATVLVEEASFANDIQSSSAEYKHRMQLETYQRDPVKAAAASRLAERQRTPSFNLTPFDPVDSDDSGKLKRSQAPAYHLLRLRILTSWRQILGVLGLAGALVLVLQILAAPADNIAEWNQWPQEPKTEPSIRVNRKISAKARSRDGASTLGDHKIANGILQVNPDSTVHPLRVLVQSAQEQWDEKVARQSKTLHEAVKEYKRRYHQNPPQGFDKWWAFTVENNVHLPDEYDQIYRDLAPFYSVSPAKLNHRIKEAAKSLRTFTLEISEGHVTSHHVYDSKVVESGEERPKHQIALIQPIAQHLPDMTIVMSEGFIDDDIDPDAVNGYPWACPISSPLFNSARYNKANHKDGLSAIDGKSFVADIREYMNICNHPELMEQHGLLIGKNPQMQSPSPVISLSKTALHADILGIPTEQWVEGGPVPAWQDRKQDKVLWRGSNTAMHYDETVSWRGSQRVRLINMTNHIGAGELVTLSPDQGKKTLRESAKSNTWPAANAEQMDVKFTGKPLQCDKNDGTCERIARDYAFAHGRMGHEEALAYKYVIDVDGNAWSARFNRLLTSGSLIFKATIMPEWYTDRIQPWIHYVPIKMDFSDLYDAVAFFRPSSTNPAAEDALAEKIASAGRQWALTHWRREDMTAYMFRLYLEWARLISSDRKSKDFVYSPDMEMRRH